jgi:ketosteroid isomerase-like protein
MILFNAARSSGHPSLEQELMQADRAWEAATQKGLEGFLSFVSDDMLTIRPNEPLVHGKSGFADGWKDILATPGLTLRWEPQFAAASASGDLGYTVGSYQITLNDTKGRRPGGSGKYITIWQKQPGGAWKVVFDSGVEDTKPAPAATQKP